MQYMKRMAMSKSVQLATGKLKETLPQYGPIPWLACLGLMAVMAANLALGQQSLTVYYGQGTAGDDASTSFPFQVLKLGLAKSGFGHELLTEWTQISDVDNGR